MNLIGEDVYDHLVDMQIFTLVMIKNILMSLKHYDESGYNIYLNLLTIFYYTGYGI